MADQTNRTGKAARATEPRDGFSPAGAEEEADIAVIGGGPAGATLARLAGRNRRVVLLDSRPKEAVGLREKAGEQENGLPPRGKCCGGLLAPDAQAELAALSYLKAQTQRCVVKSKAAQAGNIELNVEVRLKSEDTSFVNGLAATPGVSSAVLVSYNGDYMG